LCGFDQQSVARTTINYCALETWLGPARWLVALTAEASGNIYERQLTADELPGRAAVDMLPPALGRSSSIGKCLDSFKSGRVEVVA